MQSEQIDILNEFIDLEPKEESFKEAVISGLSNHSKSLPCKFFYDLVGSELFDQLCGTDEYYVTRTEISILKNNIKEICEHIGIKSHFLEFGSGSSNKVRILLDALNKPYSYTAIDISREHLLNSCRELAGIYPSILVRAICADYSQAFKLPKMFSKLDNVVAFFPGSSLSNFDQADAVYFLSCVANILKQSRGGLLIGIDLKKDAKILEAAYDDSKGITAKFNLNILERANKEIGTNFDLSKFQHRAIYNQEMGRVEMHLVSLANQVISIGHHGYEFIADEYIHTENSYKYSLDQFETMWREAGFSSSRVWSDDNDYFSVHYLTVP